MLGEGNYSTPPGPGVQPGKFDQSSQNTTTTTTDPELIIMMTERRKKRKENNKRRFSDQQIKSLETIFETESKLQPPKKLQLAEELGLHPRQVAIWFQNRRARWKSKQLEHDYSILRANYHALDSRFQSLKKEKQSLVAQLQKLNELVQKQHAESSSSRLDLAGNSVEGDSGNGEHSCELAEADHSIHLEEADRGMQSSPSEENRRIHGCFRQQEPDLNMVEPPHEAFTSPENWCSFDSRNPLCQSSTDSQWWDFWT